jgi:hypothetical protein
MASTFSINYDTRGRLGQATDFRADVSPSTGEERPGLWIEGSDSAGGESGGIFLNGNVVCVWSPGDNDLLRLLDEDGFSTQGSGTPVITVTNSGQILHKGVQIHADYVFEDGYQLESIDEHASFMTHEKHLSGIPTPDRDMHGNMIVDYGAFMRGLLEELEKAHIYIANLSAEVTKQQNALSVLSARLDALATD